MTFAELKQELSDRGFDHMSAARRGQIINDAVAELDDMYLWPYRENGGEGTSPLSIPDLGVIEAVGNETQDYPLTPADYRNLLSWYGDLSRAGMPEYYYVSEPAGEDPVVATYPTNDDTIFCQYYRAPTELSADGDTPLAPTRYHRVIMHIATRMALVEDRKYQEAQAVQAEVDRAVAVMVDTLFNTTIQGPTLVGEVFNALD